MTWERARLRVGIINVGHAVAVSHVHAGGSGAAFVSDVSSPPPR